MGRSKAKGGSQWPIEGIHCRMEKDQGEGGGEAQEAEGEAGKEEGNQCRAGEEAQPSKEGRGGKDEKGRSVLKRLKLNAKKCSMPKRLELVMVRRSPPLEVKVEMPAERCPRPRNSLKRKRRLPLALD